MLRLRSRLAVSAALASLTFAAAATAQRLLVNVTGKWTFSVVTENGTGTPAVTLKQTGETLTGTYESRMLGPRDLEGTVKGDSIRFVLKGGEVALAFMGVIDSPTTMRGLVDFAGQGGATFTAKKAE